MSALAIFAIMVVIGLIGTVWAYAKPSASNWEVVYIVAFIIGAIGFGVTLILSIAGG